MIAYWILGAVALLTFLAWARNRLIVIAQPLRLELADKGEALLRHSGLPTNQRAHVMAALDTAFSNGPTLAIGLLLVPILAIFLVVRQKTLIRVFGTFDWENAEAKALYGDVMRLHRRITFANHPLLTTLLTLEIDIVLPIALTLRALLRGSLVAPPAKVADQGAILDAIETKSNLLRVMARAPA